MLVTLKLRLLDCAADLLDLAADQFLDEWFEQLSNT